MWVGSVFQNPNWSETVKKIYIYLFSNTQSPFQSPHLLEPLKCRSFMSKSNQLSELYRHFSGLQLCFYCSTVGELVGVGIMLHTSHLLKEAVCRSLVAAEYLLKGKDTVQWLTAAECNSTFTEATNMKYYF